MPVVARLFQRQNPAVLSAATTNVQVNRALYSVVVPVFGLLLLVFALRKGFNSGKHSRSAYGFITSLAVLSSLVGLLGSHAQVEAIAQALLSLFLCIPVLHLTSVYSTSARTSSTSPCQSSIRKLLKSLLFISLLSATLLALLNPFLISKLPATVYASFPATFFLAYTIFALCLLISQVLFEFSQSHRATLSSPGPIAINIEVATQSATVPINLARSSSFPVAGLRKQYQSIQETNKYPVEFAEHEHQKRPSVDSDISSISAFKPIFGGSAHPPCSNSRQGTEFNPYPVLQFRIRPQGFLPLLCLLLAQLALFASYSCRLAINLKSPSISALETIYTSLNVGSIMVTMKAYLLHAYGTHLGSSGVPTPNSRGSLSGRTPTFVPDVVGQRTTSLGRAATPPTPPKSLASSLSRGPCHRLRSFDPVCSTYSNLTMQTHRSKTSDDNRSIQRVTDTDKKENNGDNGRLVNSFSVGSLKSAHGTNGSEESDQTRVEGSVECDASGIVGNRVRMCQKLENREAYIDKRWSIPSHPENSMPKRLLGFGWLNGTANRGRGEKYVIDMGEGRCGMKSSIPSSSVSLLPTGAHTGTPGSPGIGQEPKKLRRNITMTSSFASTALLTPTSHSPSVFTDAYWNSDSTLCRTSSSDLETEMSMGNIVPVTPVRSPTKKSAKKVSPKDRSHESSDKSGCEGSEEDKNGNSGYGGTPSPGGLRLKRSFKLDDGRTLSPQLTLAAAITGGSTIPPICGIQTSPSAKGESSSGGCWEAGMKGSQESDQSVGYNSCLPKEAEEDRVGSFQVKGLTKDITQETKKESDVKWETPPSSSDILFSLTQRVTFKEVKLHPNSALVQSKDFAPKPHPKPGKSRERPWKNIKMKSQNIAQRPLKVSLDTVFIPPTSNPLIRESIPTATAVFASATTAVIDPSTPSEPESYSSSATASPLMPDRSPMIFRSSSSDQDDGQRSRESFPLVRIPSSPSWRTQSGWLRHYAGNPITPTRGQSTFSSSSSSSSLRLSAVSIEGVKNAFSGIWSGKRGRTGVQKSPVSETINRRGSLESSTLGGVIILEDDGGDDFMDLRDPFASPRAGKVRTIPSGGCAGTASVESSEDGHGESSKDVLVTGNIRRKMNESHLTFSLSDVESRARFSRIGEVPLHAKSKEYRKERRAKKRMQRGPTISMTKLPILDDVDFDVEEALLTQKLLKRLDDTHGPGLRL